MAFNINHIKSNLAYGGARPSLFEVKITNPVNPVADIKIPFLCEAASIPSSEIGVINVSYFGRQINLPGDRTFEQWTTTIINDEDFAIRNAIEEWHNAINALEGNIAKLGSDPSTYKSQATVTQFAKDGTELRTYQFNGIWPTQIASIELSWSTQNEIEHFQVTWAYDSYEVIGGKTGDAGGK